MKRITLFYALVCTVWNISAQSHKDIASVDSLAARVERFGTACRKRKRTSISTTPATSWAIRYGTKHTSHGATRGGSPT